MAASTTTLSEFSTGWQLATQQRRHVVVTLLTLGVCLLFSWLVLRLEIGSIAVLIVMLVLAGVAWRPRIGLYVTVGLALFFEIINKDPLMAPGMLLNNGGIASSMGLIFSPIEMLLLMTFAVWLAQTVASRRGDIRGGRLWWPMFLFTIFLVFGLIRGLMGGGNTNIALWESRFLFYVSICYVLAANTIRTRREVANLLTVIFIACSLFAIEGAYRRLFLIDSGAINTDMELWYAHDDVIYLGALMLMAVALNVMGGPRWQRWLGLLMLPIAGFTLLATERRAGYIAIMVAFVAYGLVFLIAHRKAFFFLIVPMAIATAIYMPLFWNNTSLLGQPARAVRSLSQPDERDASSNLYRDLEKMNVRFAIQNDPLTGVGFGREFPFVVALPDLSWWPFWHYEPHANILWVWLKVGAIGFAMFFVFMGSGIARAANLAANLKFPEGRTFALVALGGIIMTLVFSYVDLGLVNGRVTIFLGTLLGTLAVLDQVRQ